MTFTYPISIEHYIINQWSGVNLNHLNWEEEKVPYGFQSQRSFCAMVHLGKDDAVWGKQSAFSAHRFQ